MTDSKGCCVDCPQISCNERCIESIARIECRLSCGVDRASQVESNCQQEDGCCSGNIPITDPIELPSFDSSSNALDDCEDLCCASKKAEHGCEDINDHTEGEGKTCCASRNDCGKTCVDASRHDTQVVMRSAGCETTDNDCCNAAEHSKISGCCSASISESEHKHEHEGDHNHHHETQPCKKKKETCVSGPTNSCCGSGESGSGDVDKESCCNEKDCCAGEVVRVTATDSLSAQESDQQAMREPCNNHLQKAFKEYAAYIDKGRCICRDILEKYRVDTCCGKPSRSISNPPRSLHCERRGLGDTSTLGSDHRSLRYINKKGALKDGLKYGGKIPELYNASRAPLEKAGLSQHINTADVPGGKNTDVERDAAREHVVLNVTGMTCSGCGRKAENVLKQIDGVESIRVTFVSGKAEIDVDPHVTTVEQVMRQLEKESGFKCSRIMDENQSLDAFIDDTYATQLLQYPPYGVESMQKTANGLYRIRYNAACIGARSLLSDIGCAYLAPPVNDTAVIDGKRRLVRTLWTTAVAAAITIPIVVLAWSDIVVKESTKTIVLLVLATIVQGIAIPEFYIPAIKSLIFSKVMETDMLVVLSITAAYGYSVVASALALSGHTLEVDAFFETGALLITLVLLGRVMTAIARLKAVSAVSLRSLQSEKASIVHHSGQIEEIDARLLQFDDTFLVRPHCQVVTDGEVVDGQSSVDESMITGESSPVAKAAGDKVVAGTINGSSTLFVRLSRLPGKNSITDIARLVENALANKPRVQDLADKFASWFIPVVLCIALAVLVVWLVVSLKVRHENGGGAFGTAITYAIAVLAITCPCALGLAVPMVLVIAGGVAARQGIVIKQSSVVERAHKVTDVVFDKTGTLTGGDLQVCHRQIFANQVSSCDDIFALVKFLTKDNEHPVSRAVNLNVQDCGERRLDLHHAQVIPGSGIECKWKNATVRAGSPYWLGVDTQPEVMSLIERGLSVFCLTHGSMLVGVWGLRTTTRKEVSQVLEDLNKRNIQCHIVSGDTHHAVRSMALEIGIPVENIAARQSPAQKQHYVESLMKAGKNVLFCGDGTNDAVAVAQAHVGVQIGKTSDVTRATADVILLSNLNGIPALLTLSKRAYRRIQFNFAWSAIYNILAILLAAGAFVKIRIPPAYAGLGEIVSVAPVIAVAASLSLVNIPV